MQRGCAWWRLATSTSSRVVRGCSKEIDIELLITVPRDRAGQPSLKIGDPSRTLAAQMPWTMARSSTEVRLASGAGARPGGSCMPITRRATSLEVRDGGGPNRERPGQGPGAGADRQRGRPFRPGGLVPDLCRFPTAQTVSNLSAGVGMDVVKPASKACAAPSRSTARRPGVALPASGCRSRWLSSTVS